MKRFFEEFIKGMYDGMKEENKRKVSYVQFEEVCMKLFYTLFTKFIMVLIALIVTIPFIIRFHISQGFHLWILELLLWLVWIKETTDWKDFNALRKQLK